MNLRAERTIRRREALLAVPCSSCGAVIGQPCAALTGLPRLVMHWHADREKLAGNPFNYSWLKRQDLER